MTVHPIDTEALQAELEAAVVDYRSPNIDLAARALSALTAAEHRATRAEAQSAIRGRAVVIYRERARQAEAERDEWRQTALEERGAALDALEQVKVRDARIERLENRAETETARADEWRRKHRVMAGKRDAAHRAYVEEREERRVAEARIEVVRDVLELHGPAHEEHGQDDADCGHQIITDIRRALEG